MLIAGKELYNIVDDNILEGSDYSLVNAASIDVRLGEDILVECAPTFNKRDINLSEKQTPAMNPVDITEGYSVQPNMFFLAHTIEKFNLPDNISCQFMLKSSIARAGLEHMMAGWCDSGFHNSHLTLEFKNMLSYHTLQLKAGMKIGQMIFYKHADVGDLSYAKKGRYNNSEGVVESKGV